MPVAVSIEAKVVSFGFPPPSARGGHGIAIFTARDIEVLPRPGVGAVLDRVDFGAGG